MVGLKVIRGKTGIAQFVESLVLKADGEGAYRSAVETRHHPHDGAAVGSSAQKGAQAGERLVFALRGYRAFDHVLQHPAEARLGGSGIVAAVTHVPVLLEPHTPAFDDQDRAWLYPRHAFKNGVGSQVRAKVEHV